MRKAYVLTHHWVPNFGANLQALGTKLALEKRGCDVRFVDFRPPELIELYKKSIPEAQLVAHEEFVLDYLPLSERITTNDEFQELCRTDPADVYITGSDAVFRVSRSSTRADLVFPNPYWLNFPKQKTRQSPDGAVKIALSPSAMGCKFGEMDSSSRDGMRVALNDINYLSARDEWTRSQMESLQLEKNIQLTPDPVFLLSDMIRNSKEKQSRPYIAVCTLGKLSNKWLEKFTKLADCEGFDTVALPVPQGFTDGGVTRSVKLPMSPLQWMKTLSSASGYLGVRFHPVVISSIIGNPVVSCDLYHKHYFQRQSSKTWLVMRELGSQQYCHSRFELSFLSPNRVMKEFLRQSQNYEHRACAADQLAAKINSYLNHVLGNETEKAS